MILDIQNGCMTHGNLQALLNRQQTRVIELLVAAKGGAIGIDDLAAGLELPADNEMPNEHVRVLVFHIRAKLRKAGFPNLIYTRWGHGYLLLEPIEVRGQMPPVLIPGKLRATLEALLHSHPNRRSADLILTAMA